MMVGPPPYVEMKKSQICTLTRLHALPIKYGNFTTDVKCKLLIRKLYRYNYNDENLKLHSKLIVSINTVKMTIP